MKPEAFAELLASANEALEHARGKRSLKSTSLPRLPEPMTAAEVRVVREALQASQAVLARYLNVSTSLVQAWEADRRHPDGPALVLLQILRKQPGLVDTLHATTDERSVAARSSGRSRRRRVAAARR